MWLKDISQYNSIILINVDNLNDQKRLGITVLDLNLFTCLTLFNLTLFFIDKYSNVDTTMKNTQIL